MAVKKRRSPGRSLFTGKLAFIVTILIVFAVVILFLSGSRGTLHLFRLHQDKKQLIHEIDSLRQKKQELDSIRHRLKNDPVYIEKIAREQYNMKKEGEEVYEIIDEKDK